MTLCCWCDKVALKCKNGKTDYQCRDNACEDHKEAHDSLCPTKDLLGNYIQEVKA